MEKKVTVKLKRSTVEKLKELGKKGDTYDDIINRLIDACGGGSG